MRTKRPGKEAELAATYYNRWLDEYSRTVRNLSPHTVAGYSTSMKLYLTYLSGLGITAETMRFKYFGHDYVEGWIKWLQEERKCCPNTCNLRLTAVKTFLKYVARKDPAQIHLSLEVADIQMLKAPRAKVNGVSKEAIGVLMQMPDTRTRIGIRDIVLMAFMYGTATRIDEVLSLKVGQLSLDSRRPSATVVGKGAKTRTLALLPKLVRHLKAYLKIFHPRMDGDRLLFYSKYKGKMEKLTQSAINHRLRKYAAMAHEICPEIPLDFHAHIFRHSRATHLYQDGMNSIQLSAFLGHSSVETTMRYLDITMEQESQALATLEDETEKRLPKWGNKQETLLELFGFGS